MGIVEGEPSRPPRVLGSRLAGLLLLCSGLVCGGCGHTASTTVGLMSFGDLEGKTLPREPAGDVLSGKDCAEIGGDPYSLSEAVRRALDGTAYDTLVDARVDVSTGLFVASNCVEVSGIALDSTLLDSAESGP